MKFPGNVRRFSPYALLLVCGFCIGVTVNYYGLIFESIRIKIDISTDTNITSQGVVWYNDSDTSLVPNFVHFIWFASNNQKALSFLSYISIKSAHKIQKPAVIFLHFNFLPVGEWWERLVLEVPLTLKYKAAPEKIHGQTISHQFHRGDIAKIEILLEHGGIYLDYDVILVNSLDPVRQYDVTLGKEKPPKLIAGVMIARKGALFLRLLYESYRDNYRPHDWDYNCARVAYQLSLDRPDLIHVEPSKLTTPDWKERHLLWNSVIDWKNLYVIHIMGHAITEEYTPESIKPLNSTFGEVMRFIYYGHPEIITT